MGAKYIFNAAFVGSTVMNVDVLTTVGFGEIWRRCGQPHTISLQNFVDRWIKNFPYSTGKLLELVPARANQLIFVYPEATGECSLMFSREGRYSVASAAVEIRNLSEHSIREIYNELIVALRPFRPRVLVAGDELDIDEAMVEAILSGKKIEWSLLGVEFRHVFL